MVDTAFWIMAATTVCTFVYCMHELKQNHRQTIAWGESVIRALELAAGPDDDDPAPTP